jgi:hypothetical protein
MLPGARSRALVPSPQTPATSHSTPRASLLRVALLAALAASCCPALSAQAIIFIGPIGTALTDTAVFYSSQACRAYIGTIQGEYYDLSVAVDGYPNDSYDSGVFYELSDADPQDQPLYGPFSVLIPPYGETVDATLWSSIPEGSPCGYGPWTFSYSFIAASLPVLDSPSPGPGTILGTSNVGFVWDGGSGGANQFYLYLGTTGPGSSDIYNSGVTTASSVTVPSIPANGATVYAELGSSFGTGNWYPQDFIYTEFSPAQLTNPTPGLGTILDTSNVTFQWNPGNDATLFKLILGTEGPGSANLYNSGVTSSTSLTVPTLPADGVTVFATFGQQVNGTWQYGQYVYTESGSPTPSALIGPPPGLGTILGASNVTFQWTPGGGPALYDLMLGTTGPGSSNLLTAVTGAASVTVPSIPSDGVKVYARFWQLISGTWQYNDYVYTESGSPTPAELTDPTPNPSTILGTSNVTFHWSPGVGPTLYELRLGTSPGSANLFSTGGIRATSVTVPSIPSDGVKVYARFLQQISGAWQYADYVYTESGSPTPAVLTTPTPGLSTVLGVTNVTFQWTPGVGPTLYELRVGTTGPGSGNLVNSGGIRATSLTVPTLPAKGQKVYATLYQQISGVWHATTYEYTESPP